MQARSSLLSPTPVHRQNCGIRRWRRSGPRNTTRLRCTTVRWIRRCASRWRTGLQERCAAWSPPQPRPRRGLSRGRTGTAAGQPEGRRPPAPARRTCAPSSGASGAILCVPSHALELAEYAAVRRALAEGVVEARRPPMLSLDVLAQHAVSRAWPVASTVMRCWRRSGAPMFASLAEDQWQAVLTFMQGPGLAQYPDFHKVVQDADGRYRMHDRRQATPPAVDRHHQQRWQRARAVPARGRPRRRGGTVRQPPAPRDRFQFAGRLLELRSCAT